MTTAFISDLHLSPERPVIYRLWLEFLDQAAGQYETVFILGDLFEYWVGDDGAKALGHNESLAALKHAGAKVYFIHGNRDFLVGQSFAKATGCELLLQPYALTLHGRSLLLMHGDSLCTDDVEHQKWRELALSEDWKTRFLAMPLEQRVQTAENMRAESERGKKQKSMEIMDVNAIAVERTFAEYEMEFLIHGHTHRQAIHDLDCGKRIVLADWYEAGSVLELDDAGFKFRELLSSRA